MDLSLERNSLLRQEENISARKKEIVEGLPHLYGRKWYAWARAFYNSRNRMNLLVAANQVSKSSTQIRRCVEHATNKKLWSILWPHIWPEQELQRPTFWYFYPSQEVCNAEFETKWQEFLPRGKFKDDSIYGWKVITDKGDVKGIRWNSGCVLHFKFYTQSLINLQTTTVHEIFADEEMPEEYYPELNARLTATRGYFNKVFTATLGEVMWFRAMEGQGDVELFPNAFKQCVSLYDCLKYDDGSDTPWTLERIREVELSCSSQAEIDRRVRGRFVKDTGRKFGAFSADRHFIKPFPIPSTHLRYAGVDLGSGGEKNHPAAIAFVAVQSDYKRGFVFRGWRGDGIVTTSGDVLDKFREMRGTIKFVMQCYDQQAKDFGTIASRQNESFEKAEKSHEIGEDILNTLFKNDMLHIFDLDELRPLGTELASLSKETPKQKAKDDFADALRYAVTKIPWDFTALKGFVPEDEKIEQETRPLTEEEYLAWEIEQRRGTVEKKKDESWVELEAEIAEWNGLYGTE